MIIAEVVFGMVFLVGLTLGAILFFHLLNKDSRKDES